MKSFNEWRKLKENAEAKTFKSIDQMIDWLIENWDGKRGPTNILNGFHVGGDLWSQIGLPGYMKDKHMDISVSKYEPHPDFPGDDLEKTAAQWMVLYKNGGNRFIFWVDKFRVIYDADIFSLESPRR